MTYENDKKWKKNEKKMWQPNLVGKPLTEVWCIDGVKCHSEVNRGQQGVKLHRNVLWQPNLVGRPVDQRVVHCFGAKVSQGSFGVNHGSNCLGSPFCHQNNLVGRKPQLARV